MAQIRGLGGGSNIRVFGWSSTWPVNCGVSQDLQICIYEASAVDTVDIQGADVLRQQKWLQTSSG